MSSGKFKTLNFFCLRTVAQQEGYPEHQLFYWLKTSGYAIPRHSKLPLAPEFQHRLMTCIQQGADCQFDTAAVETFEQLRQRRSNLEQQLKRLQHEQIKHKQLLAQSRVQELKDQEQTVLTKQLAEIEHRLAAVWQQVSPGRTLNLQSLSADYQELQKKKQALENQLKREQLTALQQTQQTQKKAENALQILTAKQQQLEATQKDVIRKIALYTSRLLETEEAIKQARKPVPVSVTVFKKPSASPVKGPALPVTQPTPDSPAVPPSVPEQLITVHWKDIQFCDGGLLIRHGGTFLNRYDFPEARQYLNLVKAHYTFRQAPPLQVRIRQRTVSAILNREVVLYYIRFLSNTGQWPDTSGPDDSGLVIHKFARYTKQYYRTHLPDFFRSTSMRYLCEAMDEESCIVPTPEQVINSNGICTIHDSFLFTLKTRHEAYIIWESTEEGKATYVFRTHVSTLSHSLQTIFNYIVNDTVNKRSTLCRNLPLQKQLGMVDWISHTSSSEWKQRIRPYCWQPTPARAGRPRV